jgi:hypothetical protein
MRQTRPRFTIRRLMIVVAIAALLLSAGIGGHGLVRRSRHFHQRAADYAKSENAFLALAQLSERGVVLMQDQAKRLSLYQSLLRHVSVSDRRLHPEVEVEDGIARLRNEIQKMVEQSQDRNQRNVESFLRNAPFFRSLASYHAQMKRKYQRAASRPWETVPPDPPPPAMPPEPAEPPPSPARPDPTPTPKQREHAVEPRPFFTLAPGSDGGRFPPHAAPPQGKGKRNPTAATAQRGGVGVPCAGLG